jgi:hypothetical protein
MDAQLTEVALLEEHIVADLTFILATVVFFAVAVFYLRGCQRLK